MFRIKEPIRQKETNNIEVCLVRISLNMWRWIDLLSKQDVGTCKMWGKSFPGRENGICKPEGRKEFSECTEQSQRGPGFISKWGWPMTASARRETLMRARELCLLCRWGAIRVLFWGQKEASDYSLDREGNYLYGESIATECKKDCSSKVTRRVTCVKAVTVVAKDKRCHVLMAVGGRSGWTYKNGMRGMEKQSCWDLAGDWMRQKLVGRRKEA